VWRDGKVALKTRQRHTYYAPQNGVLRRAPNESTDACISSPAISCPASLTVKKNCAPSGRALSYVPPRDSKSTEIAYFKQRPTLAAHAHAKLVKRRPVVTGGEVFWIFLCTSSMTGKKVDLTRSGLLYPSPPTPPRARLSPGSPHNNFHQAASDNCCCPACLEARAQQQHLIQIEDTLERGREEREHPNLRERQKVKRPLSCHQRGN